MDKLDDGIKHIIRQLNAPVLEDVEGLFDLIIKCLSNHKKTGKGIDITYIAQGTFAHCMNTKEGIGFSAGLKLPP